MGQRRQCSLHSEKYRIPQRLNYFDLSCKLRFILPARSSHGNPLSVFEKQDDESSKSLCSVFSDRCFVYIPFDVVCHSILYNTYNFFFDPACDFGSDAYCKFIFDKNTPSCLLHFEHRVARNNSLFWCFCCIVYIAALILKKLPILLTFLII